MAYLDLQFGAAGGLADPRLEVLRRFGVASRAGLPLEPFRRDLAAAGLAPRQVDAATRLAEVALHGSKEGALARAADLLRSLATRLWVASGLAESPVAAFVVAAFDLPLVVSPRARR